MATSPPRGAVTWMYTISVFPSHTNRCTVQVVSVPFASRQRVQGCWLHRAFKCNSTLLVEYPSCPGLSRTSKIVQKEQAVNSVPSFNSWSHFGPLNVQTRQMFRVSLLCMRDSAPFSRFDVSIERILAFIDIMAVGHAWTVRPCVHGHVHTCTLKTYVIAGPVS
jgi:hypothetical protein